MNYGRILTADCANGTGCRTSLFVSGCTHHCKECFNPETWNFTFGQPYTKAVEEQIIESIRPAYISGLTVLGGEPMEPANQEAILPLVRAVHAMPGKNVWIYSGYTWEELTDRNNERCFGPYTMELLHNTDILVDGEFHVNEKSLMLRFRGSSNQRIIDVQKSFAEGNLVLSELN